MLVYIAVQEKSWGGERIILTCNSFYDILMPKANLDIKIREVILFFPPSAVSLLERFKE